MMPRNDEAREKERMESSVGLIQRNYGPANDPRSEHARTSCHRRESPLPRLASLASDIDKSLLQSIMHVNYQTPLFPESTNELNK